MTPVSDAFQLPKHHLQHRSLIEIHDKPIRVDFTNLLGYWSELTDSEADGNTARRAKRNIPDEGFTTRHIRDRVIKAEELE
ncbi:hypothetical protein GCG54_00011644 [Colletotrichum gloeosporioides]|uniref:Uncharacterized protein n=1 Tax=Colletotrichum gloeosporioides TaxID=474922 RepID=A0A8H4FIT7_COLGL|nr:uncharacterized protein GCG54_00011644 [Colletotrichum gloeosporioides]KAF3803807.1 hypothetical protein GCG54_00011644 [Colletotrichum gloeosporioides]